MQPILALLLAAVAALAAPALAAAQGATETVVIQLDGTTPFGTRLIGTVVVRRDCSTTGDIRSTASFNGMMNGKPVAFSGVVVERWLGGGREEIEVLSTDIPGTVNYRPPLRTLMLVQSGPNAVTVEGIPVAIDGDLEPPCSGRTAYIVTNAGQGSARIDRLPNTASAAAGGRAPATPAAALGLALGLGALALLRRGKGAA